MPAISYPLAPWVGKPADLAAHYTTGFQMGMRLGAEQAANIFRQQQIFREQQKDEFENQLAAQRQAIEVDKITRKQRAIANYQGLVQSGVDPMSALQAIGPDIADPAELIGMQQRQQHQEAMMQQQQAQRAAQMDLASRKLAEETRYHTGELEARTKAATGPVAPEIQTVGGQRLIVNPKTGHFQQIKTNIGKQQFIANNVSKWIADGQATNPDEAAQKLSAFYDTYIEPPAAQPEGKQGVDLFRLTPEQKLPGGGAQTPRKTLRWNPKTNTLEGASNEESDSQIQDVNSEEK